MIRFEQHDPVVPEQLEGCIDEQFIDAHARWQAAETTADVMSSPISTAVPIGGEYVHTLHLPPTAEADGSVIAVPFPFLQGQSADYVRATAFMQQAVYPRSDVLIFPQVYDGRRSSFRLSDTDKKRLATGTLAPIAEKYVRVLETLDVSRVAIAGYSLGARIALDMVKASGNFEITAVNADEPPIKRQRTTKQLQRDFMQSGGFGAQRQTMADAGIGRLVGDSAGMVLAADYARFGMRSLRANAKLVHAGMFGSNMSEVLDHIAAHNPYLSVKIGRVAGSQLTQHEDNNPLIPFGVKFVEYTGGSTAARHALANNYAANALMIKHGLGNRH